MIYILMSAAAMAGYGDAAGGAPTYHERETHLWTNAVRVAPMDFNDVYQSSGCSTAEFSNTERTPKVPLLFNADLYEAARFHSNDMADHNWFSHDSSDGTDFATRVDRYYDNWSAIGENIAYGYGDGYDTVLRGWMCSDGHRENIMSDAFNELGVGVDGEYYTQDFGYRNAAPTEPLKMGLHSPKTPSGSLVLMVDYSANSAPGTVYAVLNGAEYQMSVWYGTADNGVYAVDPTASESCNTYFFVAMGPDGELGRFPEQGQYGWGGCDFDDNAAQWLSGQPELSWEVEEETGLTETGLTEETEQTGSEAEQETGQSPQAGNKTTTTTNSCGCAAPLSLTSFLTGLWLPLVVVIRRYRLH